MVANRIRALKCESVMKKNIWNWNNTIKIRENTEIKDQFKKLLRKNSNKRTQTANRKQHFLWLRV